MQRHSIYTIKNGILCDKPQERRQIACFTSSTP
jgi:hypothetical protein